MNKESTETLEELVREYLRVKKLGRSSVISVIEGKKRKNELREKMARLVGFKI